MPETAEQYRDRLASYVESQDSLKLQSEAPARLARLIEGVPEAKLKERPQPGRWSAVEILAHLAEDELTSSWRYRQMIEHDGETLLGFDQELWARLGNYQSWNARDALDMFRLLRDANVRMLRGLPAEEWNRSSNHAERGRLTVGELARHMAAHDVNHIKQIECLLSR